MEGINLAQCFEKVSAHWSPKIVAELNGQLIKVAKLKGEFIWHEHLEEDELFFVVQGTLRIRLVDRDITLRPGEFTIVRKGVRHMPVAEDEVYVMLIEPATTVSTGQERDARATRGDWL
jgi:mannose-6-phosphate isomerase-like protein (cupin superfamily)